jgi:hypothetical protein
MSKSLKKKKFFMAYIPHFHVTLPHVPHLTHNLLVAGEIHVGESGHFVGETDLHVPGDLTITGKILVATNDEAGPDDRVVNGNLIVDGTLTVG